MKRFLFRALAASLILAGAAAAHETNPNGCKVEAWRWYHTAITQSFGVEGVASCQEARIAVIAYNMNGETRTFLGVGDGFIEHRAFLVGLRNVPVPPANPVVEFTITPFEEFED